MHDDTDDAIIAIDHHENVTYVNAAAERRYHVTSSQVLGRPLRELYQYRWLQPGDEAEAFEALARTGVWQGCNVHVLPDGTEIRVECIVRVINSPDAPPGMVAVMREIPAPGTRTP